VNINNSKLNKMRTITLIIGIIITSNTYSQVNGIKEVNKYVFYMTGSEFNTWNKSIFKDEYSYSIRPSRNYDEFYREMHKVLDANEFDFDIPTEDYSINDTILEITIEDMLDERVPYRSDASIDRYYINNRITICVKISETLCSIHISENN
jgi:hypothetical protein